ncbi:MAG: NERD domain-containing protein [Actinomycetota bacterium]|nr:NERD domain-containing protein [Actinomycetota bacterium]
MTNGAIDIEQRSWGSGNIARLVPVESSYANFSERKFAEALQLQLPEDVVVLANQRFTDRSGDVEADLVVMWPGYGIAVIEVKGGLIHHINGQWRQPWRNERGWRPINPVEQALKAKYALRDYLHQHPRWSRGNPRLLHMVALPATQLDIDFETPDAPRWLVLDRTDMPHLAQRIGSALRGGPGHPLPPTHDDVALLFDCLAGTAIPQRALLERLREREDTCELLSEDQARVLDVITSHARVEIRGGAGSGKTWLAVEKARRLAASGKRVALMCYSRGLAEFLNRRMETFARGQRPAYAGTFYGLGIEWGVPTGSDEDSEYWNRQFPAQMRTAAANRPFFDRFDAIVIDEGHDFAESWWPAVLASLRDPVTGELYVFSDEHQRAFARQGHPPVPLLPLDLTENLRNTKQIAQTLNSLAPATMKLRGGNGAPVRFIQCSAQNATRTADGAIETLLEAGWPPDTLALLTTGTPHDYQREQQAAGQDSYWASFWEREYPFYGHVLGFKGLERPVVVLAVDGFRDITRAPEMLYVGSSRARDVLVVCGDLAEIRAVGGDSLATRLQRAVIQV